MFVVYQDGKRCSEYKIKGWDNDSFHSKRDAEVFAFEWAYPIDHEEAKQSAGSMEIGKEFDYSMSEFPVFMKIEEINE